MSHKYKGLKTITDCYNYFAKKKELEILNEYLDRQNITDEKDQEAVDAFVFYYKKSSEEYSLKQVYYQYNSVKQIPFLKEFINEYDQWKQMNGKDIIDKTTYRQICEEYNKGVVDAVMNADTILLPKRIGRIRIKKSKQNWNSLPVDFGHYQKTKRENGKGEVIKHLNDQTNGFIFRFYWLKGIVKNIGYYCFMPTRDNKRNLATAIKSGEDFFD